MFREALVRYFGESLEDLYLKALLSKHRSIGP